MMLNKPKNNRLLSITATNKWGYAASMALLPYMVLKTLWTIGIPVLVSDEGITELHESMKLNADPVTVYLYNHGIDITVIPGLIASVLALALVRPWGRKIPGWILLLPATLGGLSFIFFSLSVVYKIIMSRMNGTFQSLTGEFSPWVTLLVYGSFALWGVSISLAALSYYRRRRLANPIN